MVEGDTSAAARSLKWVVLSSSLLAFVAYAFGFQLVPPLLTSITQPLIGLILDSTGSYSLSVLAMAVFAAFCCGSALPLKDK